MCQRNFEAIGETLFEETLPNGLRLCVVPKPGFRGHFAVLAVDYGGAYRRFTLDGAAQMSPAGTAHYLEHKVFDLPEGDGALERLTANGADPDAYTSADTTAYYIACTEHFEDNLRDLLHLVATPYFTAETVEKERGIITQEIRMEDDEADRQLYFRLMRMLFAHHPLRESEDGTVESIREITAETLQTCYRAFYTPENMVLCVEGDVNPARIAAIAREAFPSEPGARAAVDFGEPEGLEPVERFCREEAEISAPQFLLGAKYPAAEKGEALLRQRLVASLAIRALFGRSSPLFTELYAKGLLNLDFDAEADVTAGQGMLILGGESRDPEAVAEAIRKAMAALETQGLDPARFERAKRASLGARLRGLEDFENVCLALACDLFEGFCALDSIAMLADIRKEECERFLRETLRPERLALAIYEPKKD